MSLNFPYLEAIKRDDVEYFKQNQSFKGHSDSASQLIKLAIEHASLRVLSWVVATYRINIQFELIKVRKNREWRKIRVLLECVIRYGDHRFKNLLVAICDYLDQMTIEEIRYLGTRGVIDGSMSCFPNHTDSLYLKPTMGMPIQSIGSAFTGFDPEKLAMVHHLSIRPHPLRIGYAMDTKLSCFRVVMYDNFDILAYLGMISGGEEDGPIATVEATLIGNEQLEPLLLYMMIHDRLDRDRVLLIVMMENETKLMDLFISKGIRFSPQLKEKITRLI